MWKITNVNFIKSNKKIVMRSGDIIECYHNNELVLTRKVSQITVITGLIEFKLNGQLTYILGNDETLKWLNEQSS